MLQTKQARIQNEQERKRIFWTIGITLIFSLWGIWYALHSFPLSFHTQSFKHFFKEFGSYARIAFFFVFAHYVLKLVLQKRYLDRWAQIKQGVIFLSRMARQWHVPVAIAAMGIVLIHAIGAILYGFTLDFHYVTGLVSLLILFPLAISGILRYKKMDRKWHWVLGLSFGILFLIHSFL
jgi:hypothetical protein